MQFLSQFISNTNKFLLGFWNKELDLNWKIFLLRSFFIQFFFVDDADEVDVFQPDSKLIIKIMINWTNRKCNSINIFGTGFFHSIMRLSMEWKKDWFGLIFFWFASKWIISAQSTLSMCLDICLPSFQSCIFLSLPLKKTIFSLEKNRANIKFVISNKAVGTGEFVQTYCIYH